MTYTTFSMHGENGILQSSPFGIKALTHYIRKIKIAAIRNEHARLGLDILLKILSGDCNTIAEVSDSWQEYIASTAFFSKPFDLNNYKDVQALYNDAMDYGFNIDKTLPSEVASSALFSFDLPGVVLIVQMV